MPEHARTMQHDRYGSRDIALQLACLKSGPPYGKLPNCNPIPPIENLPVGNPDFFHTSLNKAWKDAFTPARTAQGGGGSFKYRKPIGKVRYCESWMAEQIH